MKKVLYISNIEVPYRVDFFNQLAQKCDLTVLYERKKSSNRDKSWINNTKFLFKRKFLGGLKFKNESSISPMILKYIFGKYDTIIFGCYNSPIQLLSILILKLFHKKYILNIDGESFITANSFKAKIKTFAIKGAYAYLVAGEKCSENVKKITNSNQIYPYYFSSLTKKELEKNSKNMNKNTNDTILIVGQYFDYKGLDIALETAKLNQNLHYKFIGMGNRSNDFKQKVEELKLKNIEIIPFLSKDELYKEYANCKMFVLPSRQECWGLVINEAASFGTPIISTYGSGAAIEFLASDYPIFLANPNDSKDLYTKINNLMNYKDIDKYKKYLIEKSKNYSIEHSVKVHLEVINK